MLPIQCITSWFPEQDLCDEVLSDRCTCEAASFGVLDYIAAGLVHSLIGSVALKGSWRVCPMNVVVPE